MAFAERFEEEFINQGQTNRTLEETFAAAWKLLGTLPRRELKRIKTEFIEHYYPRLETETEKTEEPESPNSVLSQPEEPIPGKMEEPDWDLSIETAW